jgi:hypothetical protein
MKTGLIIQGPILSPGYGPFEFNQEGLFVKSWIEYDSCDNILEIIRNASPLFDVIVVSTWKDSNYSDFLSNIQVPGKVEILEISPDKFLSDKDQGGIHKYHQLVTTHIGAKLMSSLGCEFVAKIRTDHNLDLKILNDEVLNHRKMNPQSLGVPNINLYELDRLTDFYFVGRSDLIVELCQSYLTTPELFVDTHKDFFYKFANFLGQRKYLVTNQKKSFLDFRQQVANVSAWSEVFYPLDARLFKNFYWRGRRVDYKLNGWIRWFYIIHSKRIPVRQLTIFNFILLFVVRASKKPFIRITSKLSYQKSRRLSVGDPPVY